MRGRQFVGRLFAALVALFALGLVAVAPAAAADGDTLEIDLSGLNDYDFNGTALITEENGAVTVEIDVSGEDVVGGHPVHIHLGTCNELDPNPTYSLADIDADGLSTTLVDGVTLDDLLAEDHAINAHLSATDIPTYVTCGDISEDNAASADDDVAQADTTTAAGGGTDDDDDADADADATGDDAAEDDDDDAAATGVGGGATGGAVTTVPASGVGSSIQNQAGMSAFLTIVGSFAVLLAVAGVSMRVREERAR